MTNKVKDSDVKTAITTSTAKKLLLFSLIVFASLIILGLIVFLSIYFANQNVSKKIVNCATNAYNVNDSACACKYGYSGDGYNYCDECGISFKSPNVRIVGGVDAVAHSWPAIVFIRFTFLGTIFIKELNNSIVVFRTFACGGSIIDRRTILTAAHCITDYFVYDYDGGNYTIEVKPTDYYPTVESMYTVYSGLHNASSIDFDPNVVGHSVSKIIRLTKPIQYSETKQPACLPNSTNMKSELYPADNVDSWLAGWGLLKTDGNTPSLLNNVKLTVYNSSMCSQVYPHVEKDWNSQICAGEYEGGKDTCQGDSGGPLYVKERINGKDKYVSAGVVSYGDGCGLPKSPGIYGRVSYYIPWIQKYSLVY